MSVFGKRTVLGLGWGRHTSVARAAVVVSALSGCSLAPLYYVELVCVSAAKIIAV